MKKILILALCLLPLMLVSCGGEEKDEPSPTPDPKPETSVVGVWENSNYFVSFSSDGFYCSYLADGFIDSGSYNYSASTKTITCSNPYFNRSTTFKLSSINDKTMTVSVSYVDIDGVSGNKSITLTKSTKAPALRTNIVAGKSMNYSSSNFGTVTMMFTSFNAGIRSCTRGSAAQYPLNFFYINIGNRLFWQLIPDKSGLVPSIGAWNTYEGKVICWDLVISASGALEDFNQIFP